MTRDLRARCPSAMQVETKNRRAARDRHQPRARCLQLLAAARKIGEMNPRGLQELVRAVLRLLQSNVPPASERLGRAGRSTAATWERPKICDRLTDLVGARGEQKERGAEAPQGRADSFKLLARSSRPDELMAVGCQTSGRGLLRSPDLCRIGDCQPFRRRQSNRIENVEIYGHRIRLVCFAADCRVVPKLPDRLHYYIYPLSNIILLPHSCIERFLDRGRDVAVQYRVVADEVAGKRNRSQSEAVIT